MYLVKFPGAARILLKRNTLYSIKKYSEIRPWDYLWKPGPYPKTENQRIAAAKKYGLHISEYKTVDDLGSGVGDYPALPMIGEALKDPYYPWDYPESRRNFNEPIHVDMDLLCEQRYDYGTPQRIPGYIQFLQFFGACSFFWILFYFGDMAPMFHSLAPKQYPGDGRIHYTFERSENTEAIPDNL